MRAELDRAPTCGRLGRLSSLVSKLLLAATVALSGRPALASDTGDGSQAVQQQSSQNPSPDNGQADKDHDSKQAESPPSAPPTTTPNLCEALGAAAAANELPVDFFTRLIWQESRFKADAISRKGAQGIAQFMPTTARENGLENPFNPLEAIRKSGELLRDLRREFGNLGLAAAAYNAGSGRVRDWLGGHRRLPQETRAYVRIVTGRSVEEWTAASQAHPTEMRPLEAVPCDLPIAALIPPSPDAPQSRSETMKPPEAIKPWDVEIVGGTTPANALARYRDWQPKFASIVAGHEPHVVIKGIIGQAGAARVRLGDDTRLGADKLCASLKAAGTYCDVLRN